MISLKDIDVYILDNVSEGFSGEAQTVYEEILDCYSTSWKIYADYKGIKGEIDYRYELSYADELVGIFYKGSCVIMIAYGHPDLNVISYKDDRFLEHWDQDSIDVLTAYGKKVQTLTKLGRRPGHKLEGGIEKMPSIKRWTDLLYIVTAGSLHRKSMDVCAAMINEESAIKGYYENWQTPPIRLSVPIDFYNVVAKVHFGAIYGSELEKHLNDYKLLESRISFFTGNKKSFNAA